MPVNNVKSISGDAPEENVDILKGAQYVRIDHLSPNPDNARTHSEKQIRQLADSIETFGFVTPVLVTKEWEIIAGHGRVEAAKLLGLTTVPTLCINHLSHAEISAYAIADNRLAELAGWDDEILAIELQNLAEADIDFDLEVMGFETPEIDLILEKADEEPPASDDEIPEPPKKPRISREGDLWCLGPHRLLCGDATDGEAFTALMGAAKARMVFIDPPYNVPIQGNVCGSGRIKHEEFAMASGEMSAAEFTAFLRVVMGLLAAHSHTASLHYICMDWRHIGELKTAGDAVYDKFVNLCVWNKDNGGMGSFYRSKHELVFVFQHGQGSFLNNIELGRYGRNRTNVWDYAGVNTLRKDRLEDLAMHPTVKPVAMIADAIRDCTRRGDVVLDCFAGSGSTLIAAERTGRTGFLMELDPRYVDVAIRRWEDYTGQKAILAATGASSDVVEAERSANGGREQASSLSANKSRSPQMIRPKVRRRPRPKSGLPLDTSTDENSQSEN